MKKPNFLFIFSDQHNYGVMGCAGNDVIRTPNMDKLASEGILFTNAYCQNPLCVPSRANFMTGRYSKNLGIYDNRHALQANGETLPRALGRAGYKTCVIGKTHFNGEQWQGFGQRPYGDLFGQGHQPDPIRTEPAPGSGLGDIIFEAGPSGIPITMTQTEIVVAESVKWLQVHQSQIPDQPFFLSVNFDKPHFPIKPPKKFFDHYVGKVKLPEQDGNYADEKAVPFVRQAAHNNGSVQYCGDTQVCEKTLAAYYGCIEWVDDAMGRVVEALDYLGLAEDTVVVYSTDHGDMVYSKGFWQKTTLFDDSARIPFIVRCPAKFKGGRVKEDFVGLIDLMPTFLDMAGATTDAPMDGVSLKDILEKDAPLERKEIFSESVVLKEPEHAGCMIRSGKWKYNHYLDGVDELYDMEADPREMNNLCGKAEYAAVAAELKAKVIAFWEPEKQLERYNNCPMMSNEKHFYFYSNQFMLSDGNLADGRP